MGGNLRRNFIMNIKTTQEYFGKSLDELLETDRSEFTKEERMIFDEGVNVTFFDDLNEYEEEKKEFNKWLEVRNFEAKTALKTINGRIVVISV
jgi:exonuclease III